MDKRVQFIVTNGDRDGSVNIESSRVCHRWSSMSSKYHFEYKAFNGVDHLGIVKDSTVLAEIGQIVGVPQRKLSWFERLFG